MFESSRIGAVSIIRGDEPLNVHTLDQMAALIDECLVSGQPRVVLDLEDMPLIDSAGIALLLDYQDRCSDRGGVMKLAAPNPLCRDILTVTEVLPRFEVLQDCLSAVGSFVQ